MVSLVVRVSCLTWVACLPDRIIEMNNNRPPLTFKRFQAIVSRLELPRKPLPTITPEQMDSCRIKIADNHDEHYSVPSLEELGEEDPLQHAQPLRKCSGSQAVVPL